MIRHYRQIKCYLQAGGFFYDTVSAMCFSALQRTRASRGGRGRGQRGRLYPINETVAVKYIVSCGGHGEVGERGQQGSRCHVSPECRTCVQNLYVTEKPRGFDAFLVLRFATIIMRRILTSADSNYIF